MSSALAILASSAVSALGSYMTNLSNQSVAKSTNKTNMAIANANNATTVDLANTAHQREVADLRAAGLNPILSAGGSGASTPTLQSPDQKMVQNDNPLQSFATSAQVLSQIASGQTEANVEQTRAQTSNLLKSNDLLQAQIDKTRAETDQIQHPATRKARDVIRSVKQAAGLDDKVEAVDVPERVLEKVLRPSRPYSAKDLKKPLTDSEKSFLSEEARHNFEPLRKKGFMHWNGD